MSPEPSPTTQAERVYGALLEDLILTRIAPGAPLSEAELGQRFEAGRTPVREALKRLEGDQLVVTYPRRGTFATRVDLDALEEVTEVRRVLEPLAAGRAAQRTDRDLLPAPEQLVLESLACEAEALEASDPKELLRFDLRVHQAVYRAAGNHLLAGTLTNYGNLATRIWSSTISQLLEVRGHVREHAELLRCLLAGDEDQAERLAAEHVDAFEEARRAALTRPPRGR